MIVFCILYQESDYNVIDDVSQILDFIQCPGLGSYYNVWVISSPGYSPWLIRCLSRFSGVSQYLHSILLQFTQWVLIGYKMAGHFWRQLTTKHTYSFREWAMIYKLIRANIKPISSLWLSKSIVPFTLIRGRDEEEALITVL